MILLSLLELTSIPLECGLDKLELTRNRVRFELDTSNMLVNPSLLSPKGHGDSLVSVINTEKPKWVSPIRVIYYSIYFLDFVVLNIFP